MTLLKIGRYDGPHLPVEYVHEDGDYRVVGLSSRVAFDRHEAMAHVQRLSTGQTYEAHWRDAVSETAEAACRIGMERGRAAAPVRYGEHPRLVDLGIIHRGPNGFAYVTAARDVDEVEAGLERARVENAERAARAPAPPTEAERRPAEVTC